MKYIDLKNEYKQIKKQVNKMWKDIMSNKNTMVNTTLMAKCNRLERQLKWAIDCPAQSLKHFEDSEELLKDLKERGKIK